MAEMALIAAALRYSTKSVVKNRKRSLQAIVGAAIAISLITGSLVAVASSGMRTLEIAVEGVAVDFYAVDQWSNSEINRTRCVDISSELEAVDYVVDVQPIAVMSNWYSAPIDASKAPATSSLGEGNLVFLLADSAKTLESFGIGGVVPSRGTVAISRNTAEYLGVGIGDTVNISSQQREYVGQNSDRQLVEYYLNLTFEVSQIWTQNVDSSGGVRPVEETDPGDVYLDGYVSAVLNIDDSDSVMALWRQNGSHGLTSATYNVWVDRQRCVSLGDLRATGDRLERVRANLVNRGGPAGIDVVYSVLATAISDVESDLQKEGRLFMGLSAPIVALGLYLATLGIDLGMRERRREIAIMKSRGASDRQITMWVMIEASVLGAVAGCIGLIAGLFMSRLLLESSAAYYGHMDAAVDVGLILRPSVLAFAVCAGIALLTVSTIIPLKRVLRFEVAEAAHNYVPVEANKGYAPKWDFVSLLLVAVSSVSVLASSKYDLLAGTDSFVVRIAATSVFAIGVAIVPLVPLLLSVSASRILTIGSGRARMCFVNAVRPIAGAVSYMVEKNIRRNTKRASSLTVIIAVSLALSLFISITAQSSIAYHRASLRQELGADIRAQAHYFGGSETPSLRHDVNLSVLSDISSIHGVDRVAGFVELAPGDEFQTSLVTFDVENYSKVTASRDCWITSSDSDLLRLLGDNGTVLVTREYAEEHSLLIGDTLHLTLRLYDSVKDSYARYPADLRVVGVVHGLPGLLSFTAFTDRKSLAPLTDTDLLRLEGDLNIGCLVSISNVQESAGIASSMTQIFLTANLPTQVRALQHELAELKSNSRYAALSGFLTSELSLALIMATVGVGMILLVTVSDRVLEFASIMARGASRTQMARLLIGEAVSLMLLGVLVGTAVGLLTAYMFNGMYATLISEAGRRVVLSSQDFLIIVLSATSLLITSLIAALQVQRIEISKALRMRGG